MPQFFAPMTNLFVEDIAKVQPFYEALGFVESFRADGHVELRLDGVTLALSSREAAERVHGHALGPRGSWGEIVLWTDDTDAAVAMLAARGAAVTQEPVDFQGGRLRVARVEDPEGNPVQIVEKRG